MQNLPNMGSTGTVLALDIGERRIGVAIASLQARLSSPLKTLLRGDSIVADIQLLIEQNHTRALVVGLPRGLDGQNTAQTLAVEEFKSSLERSLNVPVYWQDEALTSRQAEDQLRLRGKPYKKEDIDALSAAIILDDFMGDHPEVFL
jgi:putative Holliday junction resolvase